MGYWAAHDGERIVAIGSTKSAALREANYSPHHRGIAQDASEVYKLSPIDNDYALQLGIPGRGQRGALVFDDDGVIVEPGRRRWLYVEYDDPSDRVDDDEELLGYADGEQAISTEQARRMALDTLQYGWGSSKRQPTARLEIEEPDGRRQIVGYCNS